MSTTEEVRQKFEALKSSLNERTTRLWAGAEAEAMGHGGVTAVAAATG
ncbi:MAG: ISAzo13 family transposase, partial [Deltaproteobacteria bacterium]|nr:ISAzo13 family transposase [Deltaproteobacteria bacterium]